MDKNSETKKCPQCQSDISTQAKKCPHCQSDLRSWWARHKITTGFLILIAFSILISTISSLFSASDANTSATQPTNNNYTIKTDADELKNDSDKQLLNKIVEAVKGLSSIQSIQNFREIDLDPFMKNSPLVNKYGADSRYVTITMNTSKDASMDTKRAGDMLKAVFPLSQNIESVDITFMGAARNNLGNTVDTSWVTVDMSRNLYKQIDWANLDYQSLPSIIKAANEKDLLGDPADVDADFYDINTRVQ